MRRNRELEAELRERGGEPELIGRSPRMRALARKIESLRHNESHVLIQGESGTGKELVARALHAASPRAARPLRAGRLRRAARVDHRERAVRAREGRVHGRDRRAPGLFRVADGGTLFLDEIGELPLGRAGEAPARAPGEGGAPGRRDATRCRSTPRDHRGHAPRPRAHGRRGPFRTDLFYRLNVVRIEVPPLRERSEDVPLLVAPLPREVRAARARRSWARGRGARAALVEHDWPGNVRELENVIEAALALARGPALRAADLPRERRRARRAARAAAATLPLSLDAYERCALERALAEARRRRDRGGAPARHRPQHVLSQARARTGCGRAVEALTRRRYGWLAPPCGVDVTAIRAGQRSIGEARRPEARILVAQSRAAPHAPSRGFGARVVRDGLRVRAVRARSRRCTSLAECIALARRARFDLLVVDERARRARPRRSSRALRRGAAASSCCSAARAMPPRWRGSARRGRVRASADRDLAALRHAVRERSSARARCASATRRRLAGARRHPAPARQRASCCSTRRARSRSANPPAEQILGAHERRAARRARSAPICAEVEAEPLLQAALERGDARFTGAEARRAARTRRRVPVGSRARPCSAATDGRSGAVVVFQRPLRRASSWRAQVLQTEKMASIGQLAAGVAHEINNPMGFIHANLFQMAEYVAGPAAVWNRTEALLQGDRERRHRRCAPGRRGAREARPRRSTSASCSRISPRRSASRRRGRSASVTSSRTCATSRTRTPPSACSPTSTSVSIPRPTSCGP